MTTGLLRSQRPSVSCTRGVALFSLSGVSQTEEKPFSKKVIVLWFTLFHALYGGWAQSFPRQSLHRWRHSSTRSPLRNGGGKVNEGRSRGIPLFENREEP